MDDVGSEEEAWTVETKQVEWTFVPGEDVLEKLSKLYPFRSAYEDQEPANALIGEQVEVPLPTGRTLSNETDGKNENDLAEQPCIDISIEGIDHLKQLIVKELCSGTVRCVVMDDPDEQNCVMVQLHFKHADIENFYKNLSDWVSLIAIGQPHAKHIHRDQWVAVDYMGTWHRAIVNTVLSHSLITVKLVDHGATVSLPLSSMRPLPDKLVAIPAKAMRCRLLGPIGQVRSGCILEAFPLPSSISDGIIQEPLPLKVINGLYDEDDDISADDSGLHHTLTLDSPKSSRRPPLPQPTKHNTGRRASHRKERAEKGLLDNDAVDGLKGSCLLVSNSEPESDIYDTLYKPYTVNITSPLSSSESCCSSDVGSVFSETNGVVNHFQHLIGNDEPNLDTQINNPKTKPEQKTSAVTTLCCRIKSSVLRRKS